MIFFQAIFVVRPFRLRSKRTMSQVQLLCHINSFNNAFAFLMETILLVPSKGHTCWYMSTTASELPGANYNKWSSTIPHLTSFKSKYKVHTTFSSFLHTSHVWCSKSKINLILHTSSTLLCKPHCWLGCTLS